MILDKNTKIVIYGAGDVGCECCNALLREGYWVVAGLDKKKRGNGILPGVEVFGLYDSIGYEKSEICVIICLSNGMLHKSVAYDLYKIGYMYIVFLPIEFCLDDKVKSKITEQYNRVLKANLMKRENVVKFDEFFNNSFSAAQSIIKKLRDDYIILCPLELLFTEVWVGDGLKINTIALYKDRPIIVNDPRECLFDYLGGKSGNAEAFFLSKKNNLTYEQKKELIKERQRLFSIFEHEYNKQSEFFVEGAPYAEWNQNGYWNLVNGHHRTMFLLYKGHSFFPIRVKKVDFKKWINKKQKILLEEYVFNHSINSFWAPLPNPGFVNFPAKYRKEAHILLKAILSTCDLTNIKNVKVIDMLDDEGYFARIFARMGADSFFHNTSSTQLELARLCSEVLYQQVTVMSKCDTLNEFKIIFCKEKDYYRKINKKISNCHIYIFGEKELHYYESHRKLKNEIYRGIQNKIVTTVRKVVYNV